MPTNIKKRLGWRPDLPDARDFVVSVARATPTPAKFIIKHPALPYDQGALGSCTAQAIAGAMQVRTPKLKASRLFIYFNEREMEGSIESDAGAMIRDGIKSVAKLGAPAEQTWNYRHDFRTRPSDAAYKSALPNRIASYARVPRSMPAWYQTLAAGTPIVFGFSVYESFDAYRTGVFGLPEPTESLLGGHAVLAMGYDKSKGAIWCRNSWGARWGMGGYFWLSEKYVTNPDLSDDFWSIA